MTTVPSMVSQQLGLLSSGAEPADVRDGQSFIKPGSLAIQAGTMPDNGDLGTIIPGTENIDIPLGYTSGGIVQGDDNLVATNIKAGVDLFGVVGTAVLAEGNALPEQVLDGITYSTGAGAGIGSMPNNGSLGIIIPDTTAKTIPAGYTTGGTVAGSVNLIPGNIRSGTSIYGVMGNVIQATGSATADKLLSGESASAASGPITGTMPNNGSLGTITPGTSNQAIPLGYTTGGTVAGSGNLQSGNIRLGVNLFGVTGTLDPGTQTGGNAQPAQVLTGQTFTNDNGVQTGTMPNNGALGTITPGTSNQSIPSGYTSGGTVLGDTDLVPENIKSGVTVFGVDGTLSNTVINGQTEEALTFAESIASNDPIYTKRSNVNITSISDYPTGTARSISWSTDDAYMAVAHHTAPSISIYKRSGSAFAKLPDPSVLPAGDGRGCAFSPDSAYLACAHLSSPFITIYKRSGDTFTKLTNPTTLPAGGGLWVNWSPDGVYLVVGISSSPFVTIYKRSGDAFTKLADPAVLPTNSVSGIEFSPDGVYLACAHSTSPYVTIYKRSVDTFTKLADPAVLPTGSGICVTWNNNGTVLAVGHNSSPFVTLYSRSVDTFTKLADPSVLPQNQVNGLDFSSDNAYLALTFGTSSPYMYIYKINGTDLTKISDPSVVPSNNGLPISYSRTDTFLSVGYTSANYLLVYSNGLSVYKSNNLISDLSGATSAGYTLESGSIGETKNVIIIWRE